MSSLVLTLRVFVVPMLLILRVILVALTAIGPEDSQSIVRRLEQLEERTGARDDVPEFVIEAVFIGADGGVTGTRRFTVGKAGGTSCAPSLAVQSEEG